MKKNPRIEFTTFFNKQRKEAPSEVKKSLIEIITLFFENPDHPSLRNHALKEKYAGYRSIDITGDWRAIFREIKIGKRHVFIFHLLGTHKKLYGKNF